MSAGKEIFVYAGPHRSGSQFLLRTITPYIGDLCDVRSRYPTTNDVVMEAMDEHPMFPRTDEYRSRIAEGLAQISEDKVLFANEEFFGDYGKFISDQYYIGKAFQENPFRVNVLKNLFGSAKVILTIRRQDLWVESAYMHFIHNYETVKFSDFIAPGVKWGPSFFRSRSHKPSLDYRVLDWRPYVRNYVEAFGRENVLVIPNEMMRDHLPEALEKLYAFMGIENGYFPDSPAHVNRSYSDLALRIALVINRFVHTPRNRWGFIPLQPFLQEIQAQRRKKETKFLWFLAGISRRINLHWFLGEIISKRNYVKPKLLTPEQRQEILAYFADANREYAEMIGEDLSRFGYYTVKE